MSEFWNKLGTGLSSGSFLGSLVGGLFNIGSLKRQRKQQEKLMSFQDQLQDENYQRELDDKRQLIAEDREYNSIGAQMKRAKEAGVSPLAALGVSSGNSVSASAPASSSVSVPGAPQDPLSKVGDLVASSIRSYNEERSLRLQERMQNEQIIQMRLRNVTERIEQLGKNYDNLLKEKELGRWDETKQAELDRIADERKQMQATADKLSAETLTENTLRDSRKANLDSSTGLNIARSLTEDMMRDIDADLKRSNIKVNSQQIAESISREMVNSQKLDNLISEMNLTDEQRRLTEQEIKNLDTSRQKALAEIKKIQSDTDLNETRKKELVSRVVANYTHSVTDVVKTLASIFKSKQNSDEEATNMAESFVTDVTLGAIGTIFD